MIVQHVVISSRYGVTDIFISDNRTEFVNKIAWELNNRAGCTHRITSPYHPQANGLVERLNRTTTDRLHTTIESQDDWVSALPIIAWVHRSSIHSSTNYEPLRLLIGRKPKLPAECEELPDDIEFIPDLDEHQVKEILHEVEQTNLQVLLKMKDDIFDDAAHNIKKAQKRQKKNDDIRHSGNKNKLEIGDMVVKEIQVNVSCKGGRLEKKRESTYYVIEEFLSNGCVMLHDLHTNMIDPVPIPAGHLKKKMRQIVTMMNVHKTSMERENGIQLVA